MTNSEKGLYDAFPFFIEEFRNYVVDLMVSNFGETWPKKFSDSLSLDQKNYWDRLSMEGVAPINLIDFGNISQFAFHNKYILRPDFGKKIIHHLPTWLDELRLFRHYINHYQTPPLKESEIIKAWIYMIDIAKILKMDDLENKLKHIQERQENNIGNSDEPIIKMNNKEKFVEPILHILNYDFEVINEFKEWLSIEDNRLIIKAAIGTIVFDLPFKTIYWFCSNIQRQEIKFHEVTSLFISLNSSETDGYKMQIVISQHMISIHGTVLFGQNLSERELSCIETFYSNLASYITSIDIFKVICYEEKKASWTHSWKVYRYPDWERLLALGQDEIDYLRELYPFDIS